MRQVIFRNVGLTVLSITLLLSACSKTNDANFDKIQSGMTIAEVKSILGDGEKVISGTEHAYIYGAGQGPVSKDTQLFYIKFSVDGRVISKEKMRSRSSSGSNQEKLLRDELPLGAKPEDVKMIYKDGKITATAKGWFSTKQWVVVQDATGTRFVPLDQ